MVRRFDLDAPQRAEDYSHLSSPWRRVARAVVADALAATSQPVPSAADGISR